MTSVQVALLRMNIYVCVGAFSEMLFDCLSECCSFFRNGLYSCTLKIFYHAVSDAEEKNKQGAKDGR